MWTRAARRMWGDGGLGLFGCAAAACLGLVGACGEGDESANRSVDTGFEQPDSAGVGANPWVLGGQTGALTARCGLTPAAAAGEPVPGGEGGFVVYTDGCSVGDGLPSDPLLSLALLDEEGEPVAFVLEQLPGGITLVRPADTLPPGVYMLQGLGETPQRVVVGEPEPLPSELGMVTSLGPACGADFRITLDPLAAAYVPQLKLSAEVDGGPAFTWFDYGTLAIVDGSALSSLTECMPSCLSEGAHRLTVTGELAGELGTLEPVEVPFEVRCSRGVSGAFSPASQASDKGDDGAAGGCAVARPHTAARSLASSVIGLLLAGLLLGRRRRTAGRA